MGLLDWFRSEKQKDEVVGGISGAPLKGLDITAAVEAHQAWKGRLFKYVSGASEEKLNHAVICCDDQCALGKWIYGEGKTYLADFSDFHKLKAAHAAFHIDAGEIIECVNNGNTKKAEMLLTEGSFSERSREVQRLLAVIYVKLQ